MPPRKRNTVAPPKRRRRGIDPTAAAIRLLDQFSMLDPSEQRKHAALIETAVPPGPAKVFEEWRSRHAQH